MNEKGIILLNKMEGTLCGHFFQLTVTPQQASIGGQFLQMLLRPKATIPTLRKDLRATFLI